MMEKADVGAVICWLLLILLCYPMQCISQSADEKEDVIYLKDGTVLRGEIVEEVTEGTIKIKIVGHNVLVVNRKEVEQIKREKVPGTDYYKKTGYVSYTGMGVLPGENNTNVKFQIVNGYQFTSKFSAGIGVGFTPYNDPLGVIPVFMEGRHQFLKANTSPFVFVRAGYGFSVLADNNNEIENHHGGLNFNPGMGIIFHTSSGFGWYFSAGLNIDKATFEQPNWNGNIVETELIYRRLQFGFGLAF